MSERNVPIVDNGSIPGGSYTEQLDSSGRFGAAPSGFGSDYDMMFANNPYRKQTYQQSFWEKALGILGFRTGYDDWLDQTSTNIAEYDSGIFNMMMQNQYNSESAKVDRMRQSGQNPDLLGTGDVSDSATPPDDPNGMQPQGAEAAASSITGFGKSLITAFSTGMQIYKSIADVKMITEQINSVAVGNADAMLDVIDKVIVGSVPLSAFTNEADSLDNYFSTIDLSKYGFKGKTLDSAIQMLADRRDSIKNNADIRDALYRRYNAISKVNETAAAGLIPPSLMPSSPDVTNELMSPNDYFNLCIESMARSARRIREAALSNQLTEEATVKPVQLSNEGLEAKIHGDELSMMDEMDYGTSKGAAAGWQASSEAFQKECDNIIAEEKAKLYRSLQDMSNQGSNFATAMLYSFVLNDMMQFEVSADAGLDLSLLGGVGSLVKGIFKHGAKGAARSFDSQMSESFKRSFGTGISIGARVKTK